MKYFYKVYSDSYVTFDLDDQKKDKIIEMLLNWYKTNKCWWGEILMQEDDCIIDSPNILAEILDDIIQPKTIDGNDPNEK